MLPAYRYLNIRAVARHIEETDAYLSNSNGIGEATRDIAEATESDYAETLAWLERLYHDRSAAFQATRERKEAPPDRDARVIVGWNQIQAFIDAATWTLKGARGVFPEKHPALTKTLGALGEALAPSANDATMFEPGQEAARVRRDEHNFALWRIRDISVGGVGLSSDHAPDGELAVGTLVLIAMDREARWGLGRIVRKFSGLDGGHVRFGIQILGIDASPVRLTPRPTDDQSKNPLISAVTGLFLGRYENPAVQDLLLVSAGAVASTRRYELKTGTKRSQIHTTLPVQSAGAWVLIQFEEDA